MTRTKCSRSPKQAAAPDAGSALRLGDQPERIFRKRANFLTCKDCPPLDYLSPCAIVWKRPDCSARHPGVMDRAALERLKNSNASVGLMLENVSPRLMREGLPHATPPTRPRFRLRTMGKQATLHRFYDGILIGIGETMEEPPSTRSSRFERFTKVGHIQEVIIRFPCQVRISHGRISSLSLEEHAAYHRSRPLNPRAANERPGPSQSQLQRFSRLLDAASTTGRHSLPSPRISSIRSRLAANSPASNPKPNHAASPCGNVSRCIRICRP